MDLDDCKPNFSVLPPHIITHILKYLKLDDFKNASCACKSWLYASTDPQISRNLIITPTEKTISELFKSNRRYGVLRFQSPGLFTEEPDHYFEFFEKFCPFVNTFYIHNGNKLQIRHLLRLFEISSCLENLYMTERDKHIKSDNDSLFPDDYNDDKAKKRIIYNLSGLKKITIRGFIDLPLVADLIRYTTNLNTFEFTNQYLQFYGFYGGSYKEFFTIFDNGSLPNLKDLHLHLDFPDDVNEFIRNFVNIKNLNLKRFKIVIKWKWTDDLVRSALFRQFILKLQSLESFIFGAELILDQLSIICKHLVNLKRLEFMLHQDLPVSELAKLKKLEKLYCCMPVVTSLVEIETFFTCKFQYLTKLQFDGLITETDIARFCENHPNLLSLKLDGLLTRNLEMIFKNLTKLRVLNIRFGFERLSQSTGISYVPVPESVCNSDRVYEYKISRLEDLEELYLHEPITAIRADEMRQLKKLKSNNLPELIKHIRG